MAGKYTKAHVLVEGGARLECWFNPPTFTVARRGNWKQTGVLSGPVPLTEYRGGCADSLSLSLLLHAANGKTGQDVRDRVNAFYELLDPKQQGSQRLNRPPLVQFVWGSYVSFVAITKSVKVTAELFDIDGTPLRAIVDLVLDQYENQPGQGMAKPQNPTTQATVRHTSHQVQVGDSLATIAWEHYRDPTRWREIATANGIDDPLALVAGRILSIPIGQR